MASTQDDRVSGLASSVAVKAPCKAATTANINLTTGGLLSVDGYQTVAGDRVLVYNQTTQTDNGIYVAGTGSWTRDLDADGNRDWVQGSMTYVVNGTTNGNKFFQLTTTDPVTVGTSNLTFSAVSVAFSGLSANSVATTNIQANAVTYAKMQQASAGNVVLGNATASAANYAEISVGQSQLLGRGSTGNIAAITLGSGLSMSSTTMSATPSALRGYIDGLVLSTAGSSATMTVAAGSATDSTATSVMTLSSSMGKTTSAWSSGTGNGGLDTGAIANSTWYHFYVIAKSDLSAVDVLFSLSASSPTMPSGYSLKRRIGSGKTNGSAQWTSFIQDGDLFMLNTPVQDVSTTTPGSSAVTATLASVPSGVRVEARLSVGLIDTSSPELAYISDLSTADLAPSSTAAPGQTVKNSVANVYGYADKSVMTNTSQQFRYRVGTGAGTCTIKFNTLGWRDPRGRDA